MGLRCFLFSSDEGTAASLRQILSGLEVEGEFCPNAVSAVDRITNQSFQIVIIDWDQQPEAGLLLNTARERKAAERPLTLAIVSNDADAPKALHAGANSLLRKPIIASQAKETLTTARDLLRSKQGSAATPRPAATAQASTPAFHAKADETGETTLRAGEFLQRAALAPGGLFETESAVPSFSNESSEPVAPLKELEPTAASMSEESTPPPASVAPTGTRGLEWYLKTRAGQGSSHAAAPAPAPIAPSNSRPVSEKPQLLGYDQAQSAQIPAGPAAEKSTLKAAPAPESSSREQKKEAALFAYIQGERADAAAQRPSSTFSFGKRALVPALVLAALAVIAAPQAPWHSRLQGSWRAGRQALHAWLNPQPATPAPAPAAHESFTRAGDEYKLPVAEPIPDATTDPSQITVVPVIDPTIKKTNPEGANAMDPSAVAADPASSPGDPPVQNPSVPTPEVQAVPANSDPFRPPGDHGKISSEPMVNVIEAPANSRPEPATGAVTPPPKPAPAHAVAPPGTIPQSLKSQLAPANPMIGGNKPLDSIPPPIEPVAVAESVERALSTDNPAPVYPTSAKGQQGTVVLQVLIARDGTVQDAKFVQGSLIFARSAIDAVKQWKFKGYSVNGHPVSVQTQLTIKFRPAQ